MITKPLTWAQAIKKQQAAEKALALALESGGDTVQARATLETAQVAVNAARQTEIEAARAPIEPTDAEIRAEALAQGIADSLRETMTAIVGSVQVPVSPVPDLAAAHGLIVAQDHHAEAHQELTEAEAKSARLQARLDELTSEREGIVTRRAVGEVQADDPANLARLDADLQGLNNLLDSAEATLAEMKRTAKNADQELAEADRLWKREAVFNSTCDAYQSLADNLLAALEKLGKAMPADAWSFRDPTRFDVSFGVMRERLIGMNVMAPPPPAPPPTVRQKTYTAAGGQRLPSF